MKTYTLRVPHYFANGDEFASWIDQVCSKVKEQSFVEIPRTCSAELLTYVQAQDQGTLRKIPVISYPGGFGGKEAVGTEDVLELNAWIAKAPFVSTEYIFLDSRFLVGLIPLPIVKTENGCF